MAAVKIYRGTCCINDGEFVQGVDRATYEEAEADLVAAEAQAAGSYTTFVGVVETLWIGNEPS